MNIYSISISHGKNSSHITYVRLNHPWSINRLGMKGLDWWREWLTAERVEPLNVKLKGKMGSVFVQVPWGEKPGFHTRTHACARTHTGTHTHTHTHSVLLLYFGLCSTWKRRCFLLFETSCVLLCNRTYRPADGQLCVETSAGEIVSIYSRLLGPLWNISLPPNLPVFLSFASSLSLSVLLYLVLFLFFPLFFFPLYLFHLILLSPEE